MTDSFLARTRAFVKQVQAEHQLILLQEQLSFWQARLVAAKVELEASGKAIDALLKDETST